MTRALTVTTTRLVDTDAHEGPVYLPAQDARYVTTTRTAAGTSIDEPGDPEATVTSTGDVR